MKGRRVVVLGICLVALLTASLLVALGQSGASVQGAPAASGWPAIMHNHIWLSDGEETEAAIVEHAFNKYGLDWLGTSDHGAPSLFDPLGKRMRGINGDEDPAPVSMDFWLGMRELAWPLNQQIAADYPGKILITGVEWGVPVREDEGDAESKTAIIEDMPNSLSDLIYKFDYQSLDRSRAVLGITKDNDGPTGYVARRDVAERQLLDHRLQRPGAPLARPALADLGDPPLQQRGADGLLRHGRRPRLAEGAVPRRLRLVLRQVRPRARRGQPGRVEEGRAGRSPTRRARTAGRTCTPPRSAACGTRLLGEGRHFWIFADSDFHNTAEEFWPGQYNQDHTWVPEFTQQGIVDGLRAGKSFSAMGGPHQRARLHRRDRGLSRPRWAARSAVSSGSSVTITIRFKSPATNYHGDVPVVNHVDLIAGNVTGLIDPSSPEFKSNKTNPSTHVVQRFTSADWTVDGEGFNVITTTADNVTSDMYFRLRGTNLGVGVKNQTSASGNPLIDTKMGTNTAAKAWADLWFYSNPIFIDVS